MTCGIGSEAVRPVQGGGVGLSTIDGSGLSDAAFRAWCSEVHGTDRYRFTDAARQRWRQDWERRWLDDHPDAWYSAEVARMRERAPA